MRVEGLERKAWEMTLGKRSWEHRLIWDARRRCQRKVGIIAVPVTDREHGQPLWLVVARPGAGREPWYLKTMLCGNFIGIDKLQRLILLRSDPLVNEFAISVKEPETVSRFLGNFSCKTTQMLREINFKLFRKLLRMSRLKSITIEIDSGVVIVEGHQEGQ